MEQERLKREIADDIRSSHLRWLRNVMALAGLALVVGCAVALNPLVGGIVAGVLMIAVAVSGMILSRKAQNREKDNA